MAHGLDHQHSLPDSISHQRRRLCLTSLAQPHDVGPASEGDYRGCVPTWPGWFDQWAASATSSSLCPTQWWVITVIITLRGAPLPEKVWCCVRLATVLTHILLEQRDLEHLGGQAMARCHQVTLWCQQVLCTQQLNTCNNAPTVHGYFCCMDLPHRRMVSNRPQSDWGWQPDPAL